MLASSLEENRHGKRDDGPEADPPRPLDRRKPGWLDVCDLPENSGNRIEQIADDRDEKKAGDHSNDISGVIAALFGKNSAEENPKQWPVRVSKNAQDDRDDPHVRMDDHQIGSRRCNDDHQDGEPNGGPADCAQALFWRRCWIDVRLVPIASKAGGQRVNRGAERAHGSRKDSRDQESAEADRHLVQNEMAKCFIWRFGQSRIGMDLVINPQQQADAQKSEHNRDIGQPGHNERTPAPANIGRGQHALHMS